jgi:hypothetical protein
VFENHLHFPAFVNTVVLQLLLIIIKPWFQSFIISSSPTSISSLLLPHLPQFFPYFQNRTCTETPPPSYEIIFPTIHHTHETGSEQESCAYFTLAMQSVQGWFQTAQRSVSAISPCTDLQNWWFLMRWKGDFKELLNINFSSIVHLWTHAQILMENSNFPLKPCRWLMILIAISQELMGTLLHAYKTNLMHILPLGWWSGVATIANKPNTSLRSSLVA